MIAAALVIVGLAACFAWFVSDYYHADETALAIMADSYGNAEIPFLTGSFEEVWVIDQRYFSRNLVEFIRQLGITDFVFSCDSDTVANQVITPLDQLLTQDAGSAIIDDAPSAGGAAEESQGTETAGSPE